MDIWKVILDAKLDALGHSPTETQLSNLENWILENVPSYYFDSIASHLPEQLSTNMYMRSAELGIH